MGQKVEVDNSREEEGGEFRFSFSTASVQRVLGPAGEQVELTYDEVGARGVALLPAHLHLRCMCCGSRGAEAREGAEGGEAKGPFFRPWTWDPTRGACTLVVGRGGERRAACAARTGGRGRSNRTRHAPAEARPLCHLQQGCVIGEGGERRRWM